MSSCRRRRHERRLVADPLEVLLGVLRVEQEVDEEVGQHRLLARPGIIEKSLATVVRSGAQ